MGVDVVARLCPGLECSRAVFRKPCVQMLAGGDAQTLDPWIVKNMDHGQAKRFARDRKVPDAGLGAAFNVEAAGLGDQAVEVEFPLGVSGGEAFLNEGVTGFHFARQGQVLAYMVRHGCLQSEGQFNPWL